MLEWQCMTFTTLLFMLLMKKKYRLQSNADVHWNPGSVIWLVCDHGRLSPLVSLSLFSNKAQITTVTSELLWGLVEIVYVKIQSVFLPLFPQTFLIRAGTGPRYLGFWKAKHITDAKKWSTGHKWYLLNGCWKNEWAWVRSSYLGARRATLSC